MKKRRTILLEIRAAVIILAVGFIFVKAIHIKQINAKTYTNTKMNMNLKTNPDQKMIGTWTTENGDEKLIISKRSLVYTSDTLKKMRTYKYVTKYFEGQADEFALYPTKDNKMQILGAFQKIRYRDGSLIGSILVHDSGVIETEFRKEW